MHGSSPSQVLIEVVEKLSMASSLPFITQTVAQAARQLVGSHGATFVLRDEDKCYYADEDAISPLWKGGRFQANTCISGWCMQNRQVVVIEDIYKDNRIPHDAYRPTFVKSLCMVPIREEAPIGAIGCYWSDGYIPNEAEVRMLQILANSSAIAIENLELKQTTIKRDQERESFFDREQELEKSIQALAHDIRNPLSTMMLLTDHLQQKLKPTLDAETNEHFSCILKTGIRANEQIGRILSLYRITNQKIQLQKVNMTALGYEAAHQLRSTDPKRHVEFEIEDDLEAFADPFLMSLVIDNLFSNAFKYTGKKTVALIQFGLLSHDDYEATYFIRDNGDGFHPGDVHKLFRPLMRLHSDSEFQGTGIGLASVAKIIQRHGGIVRAEGVKGQGATFYFSLPKAQQ
ncbi:MAG: HAMP domain-containing sensor histidine kinase [Bdellovibrionota bacterium]